MRITLRGPVGRAIVLVMAVFGFILAMGDVLDVYLALWKFTVPATLVYAALIWRFALAPADGEPAPKGAWVLAVHLAVKLAMTFALILVTLGVVALGYDIFQLVAGAWPYIVLALAILALILGWAMLSERKRRKVGTTTASLVDDKTDVS